MSVDRTIGPLFFFFFFFCCITKELVFYNYMILFDLQLCSLSSRSLIALSLILAMLLFKPAPIYILDEVDAALDISHTQNIGQMIKSHFKHSQVCYPQYITNKTYFSYLLIEQVN